MHDIALLRQFLSQTLERMDAVEKANAALREHLKSVANMLAEMEQQQTHNVSSDVYY